MMAELPKVGLAISMNNKLHVNKSGDIIWLQDIGRPSLSARLMVRR